MNFVRVIKVGGSLLRRSGLPFDLQSWQSTLSKPMTNVWIVGGGTTVDAIRDQDRTHGLSDSTAHWASIKAMDTNAIAFAERFSGWRITDRPEEIFQSVQQLPHPIPALRHLPATDKPLVQNWVLQTHRWIKAADSELEPDQRLPHSWAVTSDSIAAWVAIRIRASQVILLKSCQVPEATIPELARLGIVDSHLPGLNLKQYRVQFTCEYLHRSGGSHHETVTPNH